MPSKYGFETPDESAQRIRAEHDVLAAQLDRFVPEVLSDFLSATQVLGQGKDVDRNCFVVTRLTQGDTGSPVSVWKCELPTRFVGMKGTLYWNEGHIGYRFYVEWFHEYKFSRKNLEHLDAVLHEECKKCNCDVFTAVGRFDGDKEDFLDDMPDLHF